MTSTAKTPFRFFTRLVLSAMTGTKAATLEEFLQAIKTLPESVIYQHTHRFLQQHQALVPEPPNDFAYWVTHVLQDERLGEKLMAIDTVQYDSLGKLRQAFVSTVEERLKDKPMDRRVPPGKEFFFISATRFSLPTPYVAHTLGEFAAMLKKVSISSVYLHVFEARLRPPLGMNDFSYWFDTQLGETELAQLVTRLDPYTYTLDGLRAKILSLIEKRLEEAFHAPA